jgi:hypothetical protein
MDVHPILTQRIGSGDFGSEFCRDTPSMQSKL